MHSPSSKYHALPTRHPRASAVVGFGRRAALLGAASSLGIPALARTGAASTVLTISGSGAVMNTMPALQLVLRQAEPVIELQILPTLGSAGGIAAVLAGVIDVAITARVVDGRESRAGARSLAYARTPLAFATHQATPVSSISIADVLRIYAGTLTEWPNGSPIRLVRRPPSTGDLSTVTAHSPAMAQAIQSMFQRPGLRIVGNSHDNADALQAIPGSFGIIALSQFLAEQRRLALLALDGVVPTVAAMQAGRYPIIKTHYTVTRTDPSPAIVAFQNFLVGAAAQPTLLALGMAPMSADPAA